MGTRFCRFPSPCSWVGLLSSVVWPWFARCRLTTLADASTAFSADFADAKIVGVRLHPSLDRTFRPSTQSLDRSANTIRIVKPVALSPVLESSISTTSAHSSLRSMHFLKAASTSVIVQSFRYVSASLAHDHAMPHPIAGVGQICTVKAVQGLIGNSKHPMAVRFAGRPAGQSSVRMLRVRRALVVY